MSIPKIRVHHVAYFASNLEATAEWWEKMFGFKKAWEGPFQLMSDKGEPLPSRMAWMEREGSNVLIELYDYPKMKPGFPHYWETLECKHICFVVDDDNEFDDLCAHFKAQGAKFVTMRGPDYLKDDETGYFEHAPGTLGGKPTGCKVAFVFDPDDNRVEIQQSFTPGHYK